MTGNKQTDNTQTSKMEPATEQATVHEALMLSTWLADDANFKSLDKNHNGFISDIELQGNLNKLRVDDLSGSKAFKSTNYALAHLEILESEHNDGWGSKHKGISKPDLINHLAKEAESNASSTPQLNKEFHRASMVNEFIQKNMKYIDKDNDSYINRKELHSYVKSCDPDDPNLNLAKFVEERYDDLDGIRSVIGDRHNQPDDLREYKWQHGIQRVDFQRMEDALNPPVWNSLKEMDLSKAHFRGSIAVAGTMHVGGTIPLVGSCALGGMAVAGPVGAAIGAGVGGVIGTATNVYVVYQFNRDLPAASDKVFNFLERPAHSIYAKPIRGLE